MKRQLRHNFEYIIGIENLLLAWREFIKGKRNRKDVQQFQLYLMDNILSIHHDLTNSTYKHSNYQAFNISDPKPRNIHKTQVRDRLLHHALYRVLYRFFDKTFIADSYSCRKNKGTHRALNRFKSFGLKASENNTKTVWVLKCDIRKFFASIDHEILLNIVKEYIPDKNINDLITEIVKSFHSTKPGKGLPLGNLTSQLLVNVYMNKFDEYIKHNLKVKYYIRYADDFVILSEDKKWLEDMLLKMDVFLQDNLKFQLHPHKTFIKTLSSGVDFLGWVYFSDHRVLRTVTKRRMFKNITLRQAQGDNEDVMVSLPNHDNTVQSYLGMLRHGNAEKLKQRIVKVGRN